MISRLEIEKTSDFGAKFNRPLELGEWERLKKSPRDDHMHTLDEVQFIQGEVSAEGFKDWTPILGGNNLLGLTLFLHRDSVHRILSLPLQPRLERTYLLHRDDYNAAQIKGIEWVLESGRLQNPGAKKSLERSRDVLQSGASYDFPFKSWIVTDEGVDESFVRGYQTAVLGTPEVRVHALDWSDKKTSEENWPFVMMAYRTPHFREVNSSICFADKIHSVRRWDIKGEAVDI